MALLKKKESDNGIKNAKSFSPTNYKDPGPKPDGFFERMKWRRAIRIERRKLRRDLKDYGIKSYEEFDEIARELGLVYDKTRGLIIPWFRWGAKWLLSKNGLLTLLGASALALAAMFAASTLTEYKGSFTINLTGNMAKCGFVLADNIDMNDKTSRLYSSEIKELSNITLSDIAKDVDHHDGSHNGASYMAYTFYIRNEGTETNDYYYRFQMDESTKNADLATWCMLFEDGHQLIYSAPSDDGDGEGIYGYMNQPPFYEECYDAGRQYYQESDRWGVVTTPYAEDNVVCQGVVEEVDPGEIHKYTVVLWLEGYDPQCTNDIFGGSARYSMKFGLADEEEASGVFSGVYRTEYDDYASGEEQ